MVSKPTCTAVSASISTPVLPSVSTWAVQVTLDLVASMLKSTVTLVRASGWQSGIKSLAGIYTSAFCVTRVRRSRTLQLPYCCTLASLHADLEGLEAHHIAMRANPRRRHLKSTFGTLF